MAKYLDKWKDLFPDTVGGTTRPSEAVSDQEEFNTDGFPQFIAQDPVNYALQNAFLKQFLSNDAWLWVKQKQANQALDDHKVDTQAHAKGISGNAGSATKLANARTIKLSGAVTADAASFDGTADATINVKTLDASKLKGTTSVSTTGNAATATKVVTNAAAGESANIAEATMAGSDSARIRVSGANNAGELALETADDGTEPIVARQYTGDFKDIARTASILDANGNTSFPGTVVAPKFTGTLNGNAATASKLITPRTISLTGKAAGSTTFDGSSNAAINVTSVNADTASKLSTARKINITGNASGNASFDGSGDISINTTVNESKHAAAATTVNATAPNGGAADLAFGTMAANDYARIRVYGKDNNGALEIATADGGNEPIYARQYGGAHDWPNGRPGTVMNEAAILDGNGNTKFPKNVTAASFTGPLNGNADTASKLNTVGGGTTTFNWVGKAGQPNWLWGGNNSAPTEQYVYDPSNFHVASANTATSATTAGNVSNKIYYSSDSPSVATDKLFTVKQAHAGDDNVPNNGLVIQSGPTGASYNGKLYLTDNGGDGVWVGGVAAGKEVGWKRLVENWGSWNINAATATNATKATTAAACTGNSATASRLATARNIALTGNATGSAAFDGSGNISISTNVNTAANADKLDGYHASDLFRHLGGNQTPVMTDIFDRAGTINMTTMSAGDKATHKANINKASNASQNIWNNDTGIHAYGGDLDIAGYNRGALKLTQSYKNFDKILVVGSNDKGDFLIYKLWDVWALANAFANSHSFRLFTGGDYWTLYGSARKGTDKGYALSTDTIWSCREQNSAIVAIYGIKF